MSVALVAIMLCLTLASCGNKLSGTYVWEEEIMGVKSSQTLVFKGSKVTMTTEAAGQTIFELEGTYEIDDDKIKFEFESDDEEVKEMLDELNVDAKYEKTDDGIKIDGVEYEKQ
jgi:uncharacterized lipoprotein YehR (DUF1307 family)